MQSVCSGGKALVMTVDRSLWSVDYKEEPLITLAPRGCNIFHL